MNEKNKRTQEEVYKMLNEALDMIEFGCTINFIDGFGTYCKLSKTFNPLQVKVIRYDGHESTWGQTRLYTDLGYWLRNKETSLQIEGGRTL